MWSNESKKISSDGTDIDDISPPRDEPDDQDDSSNSSTEKLKGRKRPLRNRDSNIEAKISKNQNDSKLFGVSLTGRDNNFKNITFTNIFRFV